MAAKKKGHAQSSAHSSSADGAPSPNSAPSLVICRNKHWRYISSFHGPWLQLPPEILESLAHQNFFQPRPRLIDPAVFYDVVKIRRHVDEATEDSVRATTGISTAALNNSMSRLDPFGGGGGNGPKMSKERISKIRQKAVRALAKVYSLDEVAASVATMQSTSSLEEVASHVLKREKNDLDAKYVHFFHEKIPSRQMEHYTPLDPLTDIITSLPWEQQGPPLRTRAIVQIFKGELEAAVADLTLGLRIARELKIRHKPGADQLVLAKHFREEQDKSNRSGGRDRRQLPQLKEDEQPSSLEQQMLFNRAGAYLSIACQHVHTALDGLREYQRKTQSAPEADACTNGSAHAAPVITAEDRQSQQVRLDARKKVKTYAKRALKDYLAFLEHFDYTPALWIDVTNEMMRRVFDLANGNKLHGASLKGRAIENGGYSNPYDKGHSSDAVVKHQKINGNPAPNFSWTADGWPNLPRPEIYPVSALFAATPPPNLPAFRAPAPEQALRFEASGTRETVTYHPLLTDALHSLLLAHALLQTSPTELLRHAHNAARLARISDGYPVFQAARSPARADWIEVLRRANNWIGLSQSWQKLCQPAPLAPNANDNANAAPGATFQPSVPTTSTNGTAPTENGTALSLQRGAAPSTPNGAAQTETEDRKRERRKQEAILDALADDRVVDEETFQRAVRARERRALEDEAGISGPLSDRLIDDTAHAATGDDVDVDVDAHAAASSASTTANACGDGDAEKMTKPKRWAQDQGTEYLISTERAEAIARWIREAPLTMGARKKRPARKKRGVSVSPASPAAGAAGAGGSEADAGATSVRGSGDLLDPATGRAASGIANSTSAVDEDDDLEDEEVE